MDWDRTYGILCGVVDKYPKAKYRQDGHYFDKEGNQVDVEPIKEIEYADMHWKQLKVMVEDVGGEWKNKESAVEFLKSIESMTSHDVP